MLIKMLWVMDTSSKSCSLAARRCNFMACCHEQVAIKLDPADKENLEKEIEDAIKWLDDNQLAEVRAPR